jgi:NitT/TauT family transport system ATP-binding protein
MAQALDIRRVTKTFPLTGGSITALEDVSLKLVPGEFGAILGSSGCGKSTLLRLIADVMPPTAGHILLGGAPPAEARRRHQIGFVFQQATLLPWRTVRENIALPLQIAGRRSAAMMQAVGNLIQLVGLDGFADALPSQLSGGMQQRAAIARALVLEPAMLLMDEPFGALDEITRQRMNLELLRIWAKSGTTALLVTHSIGEAVFMADRVFVMSPRPGRLVAEVVIDLPRPRRLEQMKQPAFFALVNDLRDALFGQDEAA